jgi:hypothetical protein
MQLNITSNLNEIITRLSDYPSAVERIASRSIKRALISGRSQAISSIFKYFGLREGTIRSAAGEPMMHGKMSGSVDFNGPRIKWSDFLKSGDQRPYGVWAMLERSGDHGPSAMPHAFAPYGGNSKLGIFQRVSRESRDIRPVMMEPVPWMLALGEKDHSKVSGAILDAMKDTMQKRMEHEINRFLSGQLTKQELNSLDH